jgi:hypothetical protein
MPAIMLACADWNTTIGIQAAERRDFLVKQSDKGEMLL